MDKNLLLFIALIILFFAVGCKTAEIPIAEDTGEIKEESAGEKAEESIAEGLPDLAAKNISWSASPSAVDESVVLEAVIENKGNSSITGFGYSLAIYGREGLAKKEDKVYSAKFYSGTEAAVSIGFTPAVIGQYTGQIIIDPAKELSESDEFNNFKSANLAVKTKVEVEKEGGASDEELGILSEDNPCIDSDDGKNYNVSGRCRDLVSFPEGMSDFCVGEEALNELYCFRNESCHFYVYECPHICRDGRCY